MSKAILFVRNEVRDLNTRLHEKQLQGTDLDMVQKHNLLLVLNYIREKGPTTRVTIAQSLGLSRATVGSIIEELEKSGVVHEGDKLNTTSKGGRQATYIHFSAGAGFIIGIDIGRSHLTLLLTDLAGNIVHERPPDKFDMKRGAKECLKSVADKLQTFLETCGVTWEQVLGIGIATPGPLDPQLRMIVSASEIPGWDGMDIPAYLRGKLKKAGRVLIYLDNDANLGALGESRYGAGQGFANLVYVKIGTGIGAGIIIDGGLYHGSRGAAGEIGHIVVNKNGTVCTCGNRGCLETVASAPAIVKEAERVDTVDITEIIQAAEKGDKASRDALEHAGEWIGIALGTVTNLFNPSKILLDGGVIRNNKSLIESIRRTAEASSRDATRAEMDIDSGELGDKAIALGAVANVIDCVFRMPYIGDPRLVIPN